MQTFILSFTVILSLIFHQQTSQATERQSELAQAMAEHIECFPLELLQMTQQTPTITTRDLCLATIYHERGAEPLWVTANGPTTKAESILSFLRNSHQEGLEPKLYEVEEIMSLWGATDLESLVRLDSLLTFNLLRYVHDISFGKLAPLKSNPDLFPEAGEENFAPLTVMEEILAAPDLASYLADLPPSHNYYTSLKLALHNYREIARSGGWSTISKGKTIRPGDTDERLPAIRHRLLVTGELEPTAAISSIYGPPLSDAVLLFQERHGLKVDGIIGPQTLKEMNLSVEHLAKRIIINMTRWRWQDHDLGDKYILVNIANYSLKGVKDKQTLLEFPIIVGKFQNQTPVFSDSIKYLDFHPFWNVPPKIARTEELPQLIENPLHLLEKNIRLFSDWTSSGFELDSTTINWSNISRTQMSRYKLRQDPGPLNALGKVKFVFPNRYSVYMHDTPAQDLFNHPTRSFSHGCIRLSNPKALALFALDNQNSTWSPERVEQVLHDNKRKVARLTTPLPVHITYQTTWVDKEGTIRFNRDIYLRDAKLFKALWSEEN